MRAVTSGYPRTIRTACDLGRPRSTLCVKRTPKQRIGSRVDANTALTVFWLARHIPYSR